MHFARRKKSQKTQKGYKIKIFGTIQHRCAFFMYAAFVHDNVLFRREKNLTSLLEFTHKKLQLKRLLNMCH